MRMKTLGERFLYSFEYFLFNPAVLLRGLVFFFLSNTVKVSSKDDI